jgi:PAS domain S-box-containing protein
MNHEQPGGPVGRSPEQGGTSADELAYRLRQQEIIAQFGLLALEAPDFATLLQEATRLCAEGMHARYCKAMEYLPEEEQLIVRAGVGWKPEVIGSRTGADLESPTGYAFCRNEPVISSHLENEGRFRTPRILAEHGIKRAINVPIATRTYRYGILEVDSRVEGRFTEADFAFMQGFANLLGVALERRGDEERLRLAHERNAEILESISDAFYAVDRDWRFTYVNHKAEEWWKRPREELIGKVYRDEFPTVVDSEIHAAHQVAMRERRTVHIETVSPLLGHWIDVDIHPTAGGGLSVYFRDATERKQAEAALRESEEFTRRILESSTDCIKVLDTDARLRFMSPGGMVVMEVDDFGTIEGCDWRDFWSGPDHEKAHEAVRTALAGGNARFQGHTPTMKGRPRWWDVAVTPIPNPDGSVDKLLSVSRDITATKQWEEHQRLLINELNHRVKNTLATVQSIASQSLRNAETTAEAREAIEARLFALSRAHDVLTRENWEAASLRAIVAEAVAPYSNKRKNRLHVSGPDVRLPPQMALALAMALQELATNAVKYGALSNEVGEIRIQWMLDHTTDPPRLYLRWEESGGPPVQAPKRRGFGTRLIERSLALELDGDVRIGFEPDGVICTVDAPLISDGPASPGPD